MGIESIFTNHIRTDENSRNELIHPLSLKTGLKNAKKRLFDFFNENNFFNVDFNEEYGEIYAEQYPYEVTCYLSMSDSTTLVNVLFYNTEGKRKRKEFVQLLEMMREALSDILNK